MSATVIGYPLEPAESSIIAEPDESYLNKIKKVRAAQGLDAFRYCTICQQLEKVNKLVKKKMSRAHREDRNEDAKMLGRRLDTLKEVRKQEMRILDALFKKRKNYYLLK